MNSNPIPSPVKKLIHKLNWAIVEHDCNPTSLGRKKIKELTKEIKAHQSRIGYRVI